MSKKILLAEDDMNLGTILKEFLAIKGFEITLCVDGVEAFDEFKKNHYDLCIFDIMMPKKDGFTLTKEIRKSDSQTPIIFLTAKSMQIDKIEGLKIGADDYITKPFSTEELFLRINAILRRMDGKTNINGNIQDQFDIGNYHFDYSNRLLTFDDSENRLTSKEAELLRLLCLKSNDILKRSEALESIWFEDNYFTSRSMDVYITKLRSYFKKDKSIEIVNIHGAGFKLTFNNQQ